MEGSRSGSARMPAPGRSAVERVMQGPELRAWCPRCRQHVPLVNLRSWPEGVLVIGDCPTCASSVAASRPVGWTPNGNGTHVARAVTPE